MENQDTFDKEEIQSYLTSKKKYYERILKITEEQEEAIQSNNIKKLNLITTDKENHIKEIKRLDNLNTKSQEKLRTYHKNLNSDKQIYSLIKQLQTIITKIQSYDLDSITLLHSAIKSTKTKLNRLNKRKRAQLSMRDQRIPPSRFVDVIH